MEATPSVPSFSDSRGCTIGPFRPCYQERESNQLYLFKKNKKTHREAAKTTTQRNMAQMKEQIKTPEKELNKMEISNPSDAEFKTLVIRMFKELSEDLSGINKV